MSNYTWFRCTLDRKCVEQQTRSKGAPVNQLHCIIGSILRHPFVGVLRWVRNGFPHSPINIKLYYEGGISYCCWGVEESGEGLDTFRPRSSTLREGRCGSTCVLKKGNAGHPKPKACKPHSEHVKIQYLLIALATFTAIQRVETCQAYNPKNQCSYMTVYTLAPT